MMITIGLKMGLKLSKVSKILNRVTNIKKKEIPITGDSDSGWRLSIFEKKEKLVNNVKNNEINKVTFQSDNLIFMF